mmetsp:Transcript_23269/g.64606  ORF Transcript_23269/g.64606 Transcript_23269/m.64606 type:complete len:259 (-) Transcript_23269:28-804(-)
MSPGLRRDACATAASAMMSKAAELVCPSLARPHASWAQSVVERAAGPWLIAASTAACIISGEGGASQGLPGPVSMAKAHTAVAAPRGSRPGLPSPGAAFAARRLPMERRSNPSWICFPPCWFPGLPGARVVMAMARSSATRSDALSSSSLSIASCRSLCHCGVLCSFMEAIARTAPAMSRGFMGPSAFLNSSSSMASRKALRPGCLLSRRALRLARRLSTVTTWLAERCRPDMATSSSSLHVPAELIAHVSSSSTLFS